MSERSTNEIASVGGRTWPCSITFVEIHKGEPTSRFVPRTAGTALLRFPLLLERIAPRSILLSCFPLAACCAAHSAHAEPRFVRLPVLPSHSQKSPPSSRCLLLRDETPALRAWPRRVLFCRASMLHHSMQHRQAIERQRVALPPVSRQESGPSGTTCRHVTLCMPGA